jgi:hypothetical protein
MTWMVALSTGNQEDHNKQHFSAIVTAVCANTTRRTSQLPGAAVTDWHYQWLLLAARASKLPQYLVATACD